MSILQQTKKRSRQRMAMEELQVFIWNISCGKRDLTERQKGSTVNSEVHQVLWCQECDKAFGLIEKNIDDVGNRICYPCYKKRLDNERL